MVYLNSLLSVKSNFALSFFMHCAADEKVHKGLWWRIVYSFEKVCNGCVPLISVKSLKPMNLKPFSMFEICLYTMYIQHMVSNFVKFYFKSLKATSIPLYNQ